MGRVLRDLFAALMDTSRFGFGFPDYIGKTRRGTVFLIEVKDGDLSPSRRKLRPLQEKMRLMFGNSYRVVLSVDDAIQLSRE